jgi:hypothetical protein
MAQFTYQQCKRLTELFISKSNTIKNASALNHSENKMNSSNKTYDHVYVVIRYDAYHTEIEHAVTVLKVFITEKEAQNEVMRLNNLISKRDTAKISVDQKRYFYQMGRIKKGILMVDKGTSTDGSD